MNDDYRKVEGLLYNYTSMKIKIENKLIDLDDLQNNYEGVSGQTYDEHTQSTNSFHSSVENEVVNKEKRINNIKRDIKIMRNNIQRIDNAMRKLKDYEKKLIEMKYFNEYDHTRIADELGYEVESIPVMKQRIIKKLIPLICE